MLICDLLSKEWKAVSRWRTIRRETLLSLPAVQLNCPLEPASSLPLQRRTQPWPLILPCSSRWALAHRLQGCPCSDKPRPSHPRAGAAQGTAGTAPALGTTGQGGRGSGRATRHGTTQRRGPTRLPRRPARPNQRVTRSLCGAHKGRGSLREASSGCFPAVSASQPEPEPEPEQEPGRGNGSSNALLSARRHSPWPPS